MNTFVTKVVYETIRTFYTLQHCRPSVGVVFLFMLWMNCNLMWNLNPSKLVETITWLWILNIS